MPEPSLRELRTARAIISRRWRDEQQKAKPDLDLINILLLSEANFTTQIQQKEKEATMPKPYLISGNDEVGFTVTTQGLFQYTTCPCCDKPLTTFRMAEILANNLAKLDAKVNDIFAEQN